VEDLKREALGDPGIAASRPRPRSSLAVFVVVSGVAALGSGSIAYATVGRLMNNVGVILSIVVSVLVAAVIGWAGPRWLDSLHDPDEHVRRERFTV
jgi:hypothetical protein